MKEFLALSHRLTVLHKVCGSVGSSEMKGINGVITLDRSGNHWWLSSCWLQLITSKTPDWILTGLFWSETPGSLLIDSFPHLNLVEGESDLQCHCVLRASGASPKACLSNLTVYQRVSGQVTQWWRVTSGEAPGTSLSVDLIKPSHYTHSQKILLVLSPMCSVGKLRRFSCR